MFRKFLAATICFTAVSYAGAAKKFAPSDEECLKGPRHMRTAVRYTSPKGVGYNTGYTTIEGFFSTPNILAESWIPFLDLRGHVFDNGRFAANAGLGVRYLSTSRVWGINSYYDYRNTKRQHYNQYSAGLESLGKVWDFRMNGYLPVGTKHSHYYHTRFNSFKGNSMILRSSRDFALKGANAEVGFHLDHFKKAPLYFAAGPYYLTGDGKSTWGGEFRARVNLFSDYVRLEGNTAYDHFFKWTGQGQISVNIPFGPKSKVVRKGNNSCSEARPLNLRALQPVDRNEIIPVGKQNVSSVAINPATGDPLFFLFVDNTSHSAGTFESPFNTLLDAQNASGPGDVIVVFPGDGTSTGMSTGITLQNNQQLWGASNAHSVSTTLGTITVPTFASAMPVLTNTTIAPVITLSSNNVVSGVYIENTTSNGIYGSGITNFTASNNRIIGGNVPSGSGEAILLNNISGNLVVEGNFIAQFSPQTAAGYAVHIVQTNTGCNASFINDTILCQYNPSNAMNGIFADLSGTGSIGTLNITNGNFTNSSGNGIALQATLADSSFISQVIVNNSNLIHWGNGIEFDLPGSGTINSILVSNSAISSSANAGIYLNLTGTGSITDVTLFNTHILKSTAGFFVNLQNSSNIQNLSVNNCMINLGSDYGIEINMASSSSIANVSVNDSILNNNANSVYAYVDNSSYITNFTVSGSNLDYSSSSGVEITLPFGSTGTVENINILNTSISYSNTGIYPETSGSGTITNFIVSGCNFISNTDTNSSYSIAFSPGIPNAIQNAVISNSNFSANAYAIYPDGAGSFGSLSLIGNTFTSNQYPVYLDVDITEFNMSNNVFNGNEEVYVTLYDLQDGIIANNQFNGSSYQALYVETTGTASLSILDNTFTGATSAGQGYGVNLSPASGTLCLDFVGNKVTPTMNGSNAPYYLNGSGGGALSLTPASTSANNSGTIVTNGSIGSCQ